jgi:acyl-CoA synthetase (NDP forming)
VRILGPNCIGTHSTLGRLTFVDHAPGTPGPVAVISQSGGLSVDILRLGESRGVRFRSVISMGNGADVRPAELLDYFLGDPETEVIGLYLESVAAGREVLDVLKAHRTHKPVVLLAGGRTDAGSRAAVSHTGALTGNHRLWPALARQAGVVLVDTLHELVDGLLVLQMRDRDAQLTSKDVVLFGNGGGTSVLAADALDRVGLHTPRLPDEAIASLHALGLPPGNGLVNPIDAPAGTLAVNDGAIAEEILSVVLEHSAPAVIISHINVGVIISNTTSAGRDVVESLIDAIVRVRDKGVRRAQHLLVLRSDGDPHTEAQIAVYERGAWARGLPVFRELTHAASAARVVLEAHDISADPRGLCMTTNHISRK